MKKLLLKFQKYCENKIFLFLSFLTVILIIALLFSGVFVWETYKEDIINEQKEQMQIVSESISRNFEDMISSHIDELDQIASQIEFLDESYITSLLMTYINENSKYVKNIVIKDADGNINWQMQDSNCVEINKIYTIDDITISEYINENYKISFVMSKILDDGSIVEMEVDLNTYYQSAIADIVIGDSGYVIVKNSDGIILMHPTEIQIGEHVIYGREELYEGIDLTSLVELVDKQEANEFGVYEYTSYWWPEEELEEVRKIAAHNHVNLGDDFLIVSAMLDYNDIYAPIRDGFKNIAIILTAILIIILMFAGYVGVLLLQSKRNQEEIVYLKELNTILEQTKKAEENIAHQQRLQIIGTMTSGIAHEFNNMLTPIIGYSELLKMDLPEDSEQHDFACEILKSADRAKDIIKQLSSLGRKNADSTFNFIKCEKFMKNASKMIKSVAPNDMLIEFSSEIDSLIGFLGNETQINQVVLNLFVNATHAIENKQDGKIGVSSCVVDKEFIENTHNVLVSTMWDKYMQIIISDNGIGMDKRTIEHIFDPFFTTKKKGKGTGLGLSIVDQIITAHKGHIVVNSIKGQGTQFSIYLPIAQESDVDTRQNSNDLRILFVDNSGTNYKTLDKNLNKLGVEPVFADNIDYAREVLSSGVQTVFIDINLNTHKGFKRGINFAMAIHNQYPSVLKYVMIDKVDRDILDAKDKGFINGYIEKPISESKIFNELGKIDENYDRKN